MSEVAQCPCLGLALTTDIWATGGPTGQAAHRLFTGSGEDGCDPQALSYAGTSCGVTHSISRQPLHHGGARGPVVELVGVGHGPVGPSESPFPQEGLRPEAGRWGSVISSRWPPLLALVGGWVIAVEPPWARLPCASSGVSKCLGRLRRPAEIPSPRAHTTSLVSHSPGGWRSEVEAAGHVLGSPFLACRRRLICPRMAEGDASSLCLFLGGH